jgi:hypothetical protein
MKKMSIDDILPEEWDKIRAINLNEPGMATESLDPPIVGKLYHPQDTHDPINKPDHYNVGSIEAIEAIKASMPENEFRGYLKGNLMKYVWRYDYKGKPVEDLRKARWYLERLIEELL